MKKILIIEDDESINRELVELLQKAQYEPIVLKNFKNALNEVFFFSPDLILLDINIPYLNGEILLKQIRAKSSVPIIMVTSKNTESDEALSISYGADDYITKPYNPTILLLRIENIFKRVEKQFQNYRYKGLTMIPRKGILQTKDDEVLLTKNEMIIFSYLLNHPNMIVSRDELMTDLWNNHEYINDNALTVNMSRLRSKLKSIGYPDIIETRKGQGYLLS